MNTLPCDVNLNSTNGELIDLLRPPLYDNIIPDSPDNAIADFYNSSSEQLSLDFDDDDPVHLHPLSKYITDRQFKDTLLNTKSDTFSLLHLNIRSQNKHFDDLQLFLNNPSNNAPSLIGLTETWLDSDSNIPFALQNYDYIFNNRQVRRGGGVALYISKDFNFNICNEFSISNDILESLFIEIFVPGRKSIMVGVIYRPPNGNSQDFLLQLGNFLKDPFFNNKDCFLMGDYNINLLKNDNISHDFLELFLSASFLPLISKPTRVTPQSATLIDNIFSNVIPHPESFIVISDISDHFPIFSYFSLSNSVKNGGPRPLSRRLTPENLARLGISLERVDWSEVLDNDDMNTSYECFLNILDSNMDSNIPLQRVSANNYKTTPRLPWINKSLLRSINKKNRLYYKYKLDGTDRVKRKYNSYKNTLLRILRFVKKNYFVNRLEFFKNDMQNTWKILKEAMNLVSNRNNITKINYNGHIISNPNDIVEIFNIYFSTIGENLAQNIQRPDKPFFDFLGPSNSNSIFFAPTQRQEIWDIISQLKNKKSSGNDGVNNVILKFMLPFIIDPLIHLFNISLLNGVVPDKMKIAKVIPLFKKGDKLDINNYRPISLLSSLLKVLEKLVFKRTIAFLTSYNIINESQFGFRKNHSTSHALLSFLDKVIYSFDTSSHSVGLFLDYSKAFDTINHDILLYKLNHYGIRGKALEWFRSYLSHRKQFVSLNGSNSNFHSIKCGVPQGSLLGPLLFILYINDFCRSSNVMSFILFADDTTLFYSHHDPIQLVNIINSELQKLTQWIRANRLSLNLQKTKYMLFSHTLSSLPSDIFFDNSPLEKVSNIKFLGVIIDDKLSWKFHLDKICRIISRNIGVINKLKNCLPNKSLLTLYSSLILPYLNYGLLAWGNACQTLLDKIILLQKRVIRIISHTHFLAHTDPLFFDNKVLKINDLFLYQLGLFMYDYKHNVLPAVFNSMFQFNQSIHSYPTRHSGDIHLPLLRTRLAQHSYSYEGPKFWNSLPEIVKTAPFKNCFKKRLKTYLLKKYTSAY